MCFTDSCTKYTNGFAGGETESEEEPEEPGEEIETNEGFLEGEGSAPAERMSRKALPLVAKLGKNQPCFTRTEVPGNDGATLFSIVTARSKAKGNVGVPVVTWGWQLTSETAADLRDLDPFLTLVWSEDTYVNGIKIKGPGPHPEVFFDVFHGSIGPEIKGATKLKFGDYIKLNLEVNGTGEDAKGVLIVHGWANYECKVQ